MPRVIDVQVKDEDLAYAHKQDKWACAFVRAIQRTLPEATRVTVDTKTIRFSLEGQQTRYEFETPREVVTNIIKPFDQGKDLTKVPIAKRSFVLRDAIAAWPTTHRTVEERVKARQQAGAAKRRAPKMRETKNVNVRDANRFRDDGSLNEV